MSSPLEPRPERSSTTYRDLQHGNVAKSVLLLTAMTVLLVGLVVAGGTYLGAGAPAIAVVAALVTVVSTFGSWYASDRLVIAMTKAREVTPEEYPRLHFLVENLAIAADIPKPRVHVVVDRAPNAFATGRNPEKGVVAFTTGLLEILDRAELEGVVAHELAHIKNRDTLVSAVAAATAGAIAIISDLLLRLTFFGGGRRDSRGGANPFVLVALLAGAVLAPISAMLLQAAVSRRREALADASAVAFTRNPAGLRQALEKLQHDSTVVQARAASVAHVWIESPLSAGSLNHLFATHPPLADRIAVLRRLEGLG